ncbi:MAG: enoyl-CoA hydratase/isomerase family protein [Acidobacteriia bacterium]|nr:enoyl-CoA hydratase/isomerase family protein [Terriglobia bacterium]
MTHIRMERVDGIGLITIDRPARFNSLDVRTAQDFRRAGLQYAREDDVRVVVLRGLPGMFCSGADLKFIRDGGDAGDLGYLAPDAPHAGYGETFKQILEYIHSTISEIRRAPKPFIAAVDGIAAAGGFGIAMSCDLVVASTRATFEWAYSKTGLTGAESSTFLLPKLIGLRRSMELMLLNPRLSAEQALDYGLITAVFEVEDFDRRTLEMAHRLAAGPKRAFAIAKELLNQAAGVDRLDAHLDQELDELARVADGPEFAEGLEAFFQKRPAQFGNGTTEDTEDTEGKQSKQVSSSVSPVSSVVNR